MRSYTIAFLLAGLWPGQNFAQVSKDTVIYFNGFFQLETDTNRIQYYGIPKRIHHKLFEVTFFTLDSQAVATGEYKNKKLKNRNGIFARYNSEGKVIVTAHYRKGMLNGVYKKFFDNGKLSDSGNIYRGVLVGLWKSWYPTGQLKELKNFINYNNKRSLEYTVLDKQYISWYPNGSLDDSGYYSNNQKQGVWIEWIQDGLVKSVGEYKNGWKRGTWKYYDSKGKLLYFRRFSRFTYDGEGVRQEIK